MAGPGKIEKYRLEERVLALAAEGRNTYQIAARITEELDGKDTISQPTVARWLKRTRRERSEQTRALVHEHIKAAVPKDLEALEEIEGFLMAVFRNRTVDPETGEEQPLQHDLSTRVDAGMKAVRIIETKLRFSGVLEDPQGAGAGGEVHPVDLDEYRRGLAELKQEVQGG